MDTLTAVATKLVTHRGLKEGTVLVDEFDCPCAIIDHRIGVRQGSVYFLVEDLDEGGWSEVPFINSLKPTIKVAA